MAFSLALMASYFLSYVFTVDFYAYHDLSIAGELLGSVASGSFVGGMIADAKGRTWSLRLWVIAGIIGAIVGLFVGFQPGEDTDIQRWAPRFGTIVLGLAAGAMVPAALVYSYESVLGRKNHSAVIYDRRRIIGVSIGESIIAIGGLDVVVMLSSLAVSGASLYRIALIATILIGVRSLVYLHTLSDSDEVTMTTSAPFFVSELLKHRCHKFRFAGLAAVWLFHSMVWYGSLVVTLNLARQALPSGEEYYKGPALAWFAFLVLIGQFPALVVTIILLEQSAPKALQFIGFLLSTVSLLIVQYFAGTEAPSVAFFVLLVFHFSLSFGGLLTAVICAVEVFPVRLRCSVVGALFAIGMIGALISTGWDEESSVGWRAYALSAVAGIGAMATRFLIEDSPSSTDQTCIFKIASHETFVDHRRNEPAQDSSSEGKSEESDSEVSPPPVQTKRRDKDRLIDDGYSRSDEIGAPVSGKRNRVQPPPPDDESDPEADLEAGGDYPEGSGRYDPRDFDETPPARSGRNRSRSRERPPERVIGRERSRERIRGEPMDPGLDMGMGVSAKKSGRSVPPTMAAVGTLGGSNSRSRGIGGGGGYNLNHRLASDNEGAPPISRSGNMYGDDMPSRAPTSGKSKRRAF